MYVGITKSSYLSLWFRKKPTQTHPVIFRYQELVYLLNFSVYKWVNIKNIVYDMYTRKERALSHEVTVICILIIDFFPFKKEGEYQVNVIQPFVTFWWQVTENKSLFLEVMSGRNIKIF